MTRLIAHEWIERFGGAEKVLDVFVEMFPKSELFTLWNDAPQRYPNRIVRESGLARTPLRRHKSAALATMSSVWRRADVSDFDTALISSHAFAHHLGSGSHQRHLRRHIYVHTPARYIWAPDIDPRGRHALARLTAPILRHQDRKYAGGAEYAANSHFVQSRIRSAWGFDSQVIYPPVDVRTLQKIEDWASTLEAVERDHLARLPNEFILGASRFVSYKSLERVIDFGHLIGIPVVIAGSGPEEGSLRARARTLDHPTHFVLSPSDNLIRTLYQAACAFVYPPVEDFGIMPVEAMSLGTPVIVNSVGGAAESAALLGGGVSLNFDSYSRADAVRAFNVATAIGMSDATRQSLKLDSGEFTHRIRSWVDG